MLILTQSYLKAPKMSLDSKSLRSSFTGKITNVPRFIKQNLIKTLFFMTYLLQENTFLTCTLEIKKFIKAERLHIVPN